MLYNILAITIMILGFGFVVFFHELGHFLAAKWAGIKVEQFAVGFGQAVCSWRSGLGFTWGSTRKKLAAMEQRGDDTSKLGETEYRINWMPLGGYVKMLGQDDMNPNATSDDPRSFNRKSVGARMFVVSAGVIMNVILAAILFPLLFMVGHKVTEARIGSVMPLSPAQAARARVGDRALSFDDANLYNDFGKLQLNIALAHEGSEIPLVVQRPDGKIEHLTIEPRKSGDRTGLLQVGVGPYLSLTSPFEKQPELWDKMPNEARARALAPDERIIQVERQPVAPDEYYKLYEAAQVAAGQPVTVTLANSAGATRTIEVPTEFVPPYGKQPLSIAGMEPLPAVSALTENSIAQGLLEPGDVLTWLQVGSEVRSYPSTSEFLELVSTAGAQDKPVVVGYTRNGEPGQTPSVVPNVRLDRGLRGLGIGIDYDAQTTRVANVLRDSAAARASIPRGARILTVAGRDVTGGWFTDGGWAKIYRILRDAKGEVPITYENESLGQTRVLTTALNVDPEKAQLARLNFAPKIALPPMEYVRETSNPLLALRWGVTETRDMLLQMYVQLHRLVTGAVPASNAMGPIGIVQAGSRFAMKGPDWIIWFLAMISANLAVVNFLPIPIVDGGLFLFLILEKIQGKPLSPRMQTVAQLVGLAIILSVFVFVTYNDIARIFL